MVQAAKRPAATITVAMVSEGSAAAHHLNVKMVPVRLSESGTFGGGDL